MERKDLPTGQREECLYCLNRLEINGAAVCYIEVINKTRAEALLKTTDGSVLCKGLETDYTTMYTRRVWRAIEKLITLSETS